MQKVTGKQSPRKKIPVVQKILSANDQAAAANREHLNAHQIAMFNIMASQVAAEKIAPTGAPLPRLC
ncbi:MAG: hypothetical protein K8R89_04105 [Anaerolineae bacterium]|nr:hypothetical protein [Anaerolineae bacterium]